MPLLAAVSRGMKSNVERALVNIGVHAGQEFILQCLWPNDGQTPGELAKRIGVETPTITRAVQRMEAAGLVERRLDPTDARLVRVYLTEHGRQLQTIIPDLLGRLTEQALRGLSESERATLGHLLDRVQKNLKEEAD